jgi:hypothetical protein
MLRPQSLIHTLDSRRQDRTNTPPLAARLRSSTIDHGPEMRKRNKRRSQQRSFPVSVGQTPLSILDHIRRSINSCLLARRSVRLQLASLDADDVATLKKRKNCLMSPHFDAMPPMIRNAGETAARLWTHQRYTG